MFQANSILVTGGSGFIASNFLFHMVKKYPNIVFINVDKVDYCSTADGLPSLKSQPNYFFYHTNIANNSFIEHILTHHNVDAVIHFAAQSHVDNSFGNSINFTVDNVLGTHHLLETVRKYGRVKRFIHVSTDEVYGEVAIDETSSEKSLLNPTNPYAASKAAAEFIVKSYNKSYDIPIIITRGNNVYGPGQYPEKLIPKFLMQLINGKKMTIHGSGLNIRNYIYVEDVARAFETILFKGEERQIYNIGTDNEYSVMDIATRLHKIMYPTTNLDAHIQYVDDRLFNDFRYSIDSNNLHCLGWKPEIDFETGLQQTIDWYKTTNIETYFESTPRL
jgi:dTDP-glucose 4,6-dehydratase